jgi:hypothetical protein
VGSDGGPCKPRKSAPTEGEAPEGVKAVPEVPGERADARAVQLASPGPCREPGSSPEALDAVFEVGMLQPAPSMTADVCSKR